PRPFLELRNDRLCAHAELNFDTVRVMSGAAPEPQGRSYTQLLGAMNELLAILLNDGDHEAALRASFEAAARGFGAQKALLLVIEERDPLRLRAVHVLGKLTPEQVRACERGESVQGVSPSVIYRVIETGAPELIEDPRLLADAGRTPSLAGGQFSVLCADPRSPARSRARRSLFPKQQPDRGLQGRRSRLARPLRHGRGPGLRLPLPQAATGARASRPARNRPGGRRHAGDPGRLGPHPGAPPRSPLDLHPLPRSREPRTDPDPRRAWHRQRPDRPLPPRLQLLPQAPPGRRQLRRDHRRARGLPLLRSQERLL